VPESTKTQTINTPESRLTSSLSASHHPALVVPQVSTLRLGLVAATELFALRSPCTTRSPLRYPGGKSRGVNSILEYIPAGISHLLSPFLGGGWIELALGAQRGVVVHGYDLYEPVTTFWRCLQSDAARLADEAARFYPLPKKRFYELQRTFEDFRQFPFSYAARFFVLNRSSYSGTTLSGGMSAPEHTRFTLSAIARLREFWNPHLKVGHLCFTESLLRHPDLFVYADPPYLVDSALYGTKGSTHRNFDHLALRDLLGSRHGWVLSYNDCPEIRKLYNGYRILTPQWSYSMTKDKASRELLILGPGA